MGKETGRIVTGDFTPPTVIVAVRQRASALPRRCHCRCACGPAASTSPSDGIDVPCTNAALAYVYP